MPRPLPRRFAVPALAALLLLPADSALAEPLPRAVLHVAGERQRGALWSSADSNGNGEVCSVGHGDGVPIPPKRAIEVDPGRFHGRIVLRRADEPRNIKLAGYTKTDENGYVTGPREEVEWRLRPRPADEPRKWVVKLRSRVDNHLYLRLGAAWRDPGGCGGDRGSWIFHVRADG